MSESAPRPRPGERIEPPRHRVTLAEYLGFEEAHPDKHEYVGGYIYAMAPPTTPHQVIAQNIGAHLWAAARGTACWVVQESGLYINDEDVVRPDVVVTCEPIRPSDMPRTPCLVVEVLSPSTARDDRTAKRLAYLALPSAHAYWIVSQDWRSVERYWRDASGAWQLEHVTGDGTLPVPCLARPPLTLDEVYERVDAPHTPPPPRRVREPLRDVWPEHATA
jgi:Uma2 family endonuclease